MIKPPPSSSVTEEPTECIATTKQPRATAARLGLVLLLASAATACSRGEGEPEESESAPQEASAEAGETAESTQLSAEAPAAPSEPVAPIEVAPNRDRRPEVEGNRDLAERLGLAPPEPLRVSDLLTRADVRELTGFQGELLETGLAGIAPSPGYNTIRLRADGGYGFGLQVWQAEEIRQASSHFRRLRETYFDSQVESSGVGNEAFTADFQGLRHYAFLHRQSKTSAVVTCDRTLCDEVQVRALAQRVGNRL